MTTTQNTQQTSTTSSSTTFGDFGTFQPGTMAVCSSELQELARIYTEIANNYGEQVLNALNEQNAAAKANQNAFEQMGENEQLAALTSGLGEISNGIINLGTAIYNTKSMSPEHQEIDDINGKIKNAKTYREACKNRDSDITSSTLPSNGESPSSIEQLKRPGYDFGSREINENEKNDIRQVTAESDIIGKDGVMANVDKYIQSQEDQKNMLQRQISDRITQRNTYAQGINGIVKGSADSIAGHFKYESAVWQGQQSLAGNALQNAQKATDTAVSQEQSMMQELNAVYTTMTQINKANAANL